MFQGLGLLLDLTPGTAEKMIEQGLLKGTIDQVVKLILFENKREEDDGQGKAGGLDEVEEVEDTEAPFMKHWDMQIRQTAANVSHLHYPHLLYHPPNAQIHTGRKYCTVSHRKRPSYLASIEIHV